MLLHPDPSLAEVPGFSREQLDALAGSVELRRQQLEQDIEQYIRQRQHELRTYEQELLAQHRSMECLVDPKPVQTNSGRPPLPLPLPPPPPPPPPTAESEEKARRTKHTRVQKREKELYGLVTPVFLPLLEHTTPAGDAERRKDGRKPTREHSDMDATAPVEAVKEPAAHPEPLKKAKRSPLKKSSLRQHNTSRSRRKRVSLVIDGHTVLPADTVTEPALLSPSSEATSASNSTASLDDMIDPLLTRHDLPAQPQHQDAVHHSLPLPMSNITHAPTKPLVETPTSVTTTAPIASYSPPEPPAQSFLEPPHPLPATAGPDPIFATDDDTADQAFSTYVGGLRGSGADDVDQAGSYGYPSSLGASYLESYMQSRPLRVRMEAADKAGLDEREKKVMIAGVSDGGDKDDGEPSVSGHEVGRRRSVDDGDEDMDIMGEMEGF